MKIITDKGKSPQISVILTCYNRKKLIMRAAESVLNQSYDDFELIVVDDGSDDGSYRPVFRLIELDHRIKYVRHSNRGTQLSLNTGISTASGKYITFLDSDDEYSANHLSERISYYKKDKKTELIYSDAIITGKEEDMWVPDARNPKKKIHLNDCIIGATLFGKDYVFRELGGFRNIYSHDSDFVRRAGRKYNVHKFDSRTYIYHRESHDSILSKLNRRIG